MAQSVGGPKERVAGSEERLFLWVRGGLYGAGAFVVGWVVTYALLVAAEIGAEVASTVGHWRLATWTYLGTHAVPITADVEAALSSGNVATQLASDRAAVYALLVVSPLLLAIIGWHVARTRPVGTRWALVGPTIVIGYFPLALVAGLLSRYAPADAPAAEPHIGLLAVLAGVTFPLVFGFLGSLKGRHRATS